MATRRSNPVENDRLTGFGMIQPGAGRDRAAEGNMSDTEKKYVKSRGRSKSSYEAVRRARKANQQPDVDY